MVKVQSFILFRRQFKKSLSYLTLEQTGPIFIKGQNAKYCLRNKTERSDCDL